MTQIGSRIATNETGYGNNQPASVSERGFATNVVRKSTPSVNGNDPNTLLARVAVYYKVFSADEIKSALEDWMAVGSHQDFADFLLAKNYLTADTIAQLTQARDKYLQQQEAPVVALTPQTSARETPSTVTPEAETDTPAAVVPEQAQPEPASESVPVVEPPARPTLKPVPTAEPAARAQVQTNTQELLRYAPGVTLQDLLQQTSKLGASDLHVHSGASLRVRLHGQILEASPAVLTDAECDGLIRPLLNETQLEKLKEKFQVDFSYEIPGVGRYRANAYQQRRGIDAVFRTIKPTPPTLAELGLPKELEQYTDFHQGLVLFTGPAGCGKSSTMAAMVDLINKRRHDHILTIEDPIEYVHDSASCNVNQREAGFHTSTFSKALRAALREDPDVIVIGELRDFETISLALTAAETGHLVLGTLHTSGAIRTVNRLLGVFPPDQQAQLRVMLSESLKVVISQHLVQRADGRGQVPALEILVNNKATGNLIRENRTFQIKSLMQTGAAEGQRLLDASLTKLLLNRVITKEEAIRHADEPDNFK